MDLSTTSYGFLMKLLISGVIASQVAFFTRY